MNGRHVPEVLGVAVGRADPVGGVDLEDPASGVVRGAGTPPPASPLVPAEGPEDVDDGTEGRAANAASSQAIWSAVNGVAIPTRCTGWLVRNACCTASCTPNN